MNENGFLVNGEWFDDLRFTVPAATDLSRVVVDDAHRDEIVKARATVDRLSEVLVVKQKEVDLLRTEVRRLAAVLDVVTADRDEWQSAAEKLARLCRELAAALERARDLAVRACAFDPVTPPWGGTTRREGIPEAPRSTLGDQSAGAGPIPLPTDLDGLEAERDDGR